MEVRIDVPLAALDDVYVADISLVAAVVSASTGDINVLPTLLAAPQLHALISSAAQSDDPLFASQVLFAGTGRQERSRAHWSIDRERARQLLLHVEGQPGAKDESDPRRHDSATNPRSPEDVVASIRLATRELARQTERPVLSIGDAFKRSLRDMPTLTYGRAVSGLESLRRSIHGNTGDDRRCVWITLFGWTVGSLLGIEGMPSQEEIAIAVDP